MASLFTKGGVPLTAFFSRSVSHRIRKLWASHGGTIVGAAMDFTGCNYVFCAGIDDPFLEPLSCECITVIHAEWVLQAVAEQFIMPISRYILDDHFDPTFLSQSIAIQLEGQHCAAEHVKTECTPLDVSALSETLPGNLSDGIATKRCSSLTSKPRHNKRRRFSVCPPLVFVPSWATEEDSYDDQTLVDAQSPETKSSLLLSYSSSQLTRCSPSSTHAAHVAAWRSCKSTSADLTACPSLSIEKLMRVLPEQTDAGAALFVRGEVYLGKQFRFLGRERMKTT